MNYSMFCPTDETIRAAYFYLMARVLVLRRERQDVREAPYNAIKYNDLSLRSPVFVNPNLGVASLEAWLAVDELHAVVLHIPEIRNRYYTVQIVDGWGEVIANINDRTHPEHPWGKVAFIHRGARPEVPPDALVIELPAAKAKLLARIQLADTPDEARALQRAFTLTAPEGIRIEPPLLLPPFHGAALPGPWIFAGVEALLGGCPDSMPDAPKLQLMARDVEDWLYSDQGAREHLEALIQDRFVPYFYRTLMGGRPDQGGWTMIDFCGRYGNRYELRSLVNFAGLWANVPEEILYYVAFRDADGAPLSGGNDYVLCFPKGALPDAACDGFWSLTVLRLPDLRVMPESRGRLTLRSASGTEVDALGNLALYVSPASPDGVPRQNWLPSPPGMPITLTFRLHAPRANALSRQWFPPPLIRLY